MAKARRRKNSIVTAPPASTSSASVAAQSCRKTIRKYHVLLKKRRQLESQTAHGQVLGLEEIDEQLAALGGLEKYQELSSLGQREERGGGSEKIFIAWMRELDVHRTQEGKEKLRLLEVGALKPDNYKSCLSWIDCMPIDLHSRHPQIVEQDFLNLDINEHKQRWNAISLSLVLNFVPLPNDRATIGRMLRLAHEMLTAEGLLFLALPLPCVANSRYITFDHLKSLMESIGFAEVKERWKRNGKMGYWLYRKTHQPLEYESPRSFTTKVILRTGQRNNFAILLEPATCHT
ncbi:nucleolus protein [Pholiota conissans]|uniref:25S rRNA adenine-N(1) methyltransferase n=1 Tax=Pholiota conissans TaxID=109636 RepID=A0A9P5YTB3_9AGAR|nr:nucleolus protein [Pholiota conissans]